MKSVKGILQLLSRNSGAVNSAYLMIEQANGLDIAKNY